jgi:hypothetical protein
MHGLTRGKVAAGGPRIGTSVGTDPTTDAHMSLARTSRNIAERQTLGNSGQSLAWPRVANAVSPELQHQSGLQKGTVQPLRKNDIQGLRQNGSPRFGGKHPKLKL